MQQTGEVMQLMAKAWRQELECGHLRGEPLPYWHQHVRTGVLNLEPDLLQCKVESELSKFHSDNQMRLTAVLADRHGYRSNCC